MNIRFGCVAAGAGMAFGAAAFAHVDDPKECDRLPRYEGPGYKADEGGVASVGFPSENVTLLSWLTVGEMDPGSSAANDCWGYVSQTGREYAIVGLSSSTAFVDITNPGSPVVVEVIDGPNSTWRDIKVYQDHAYSVSEGGDGIQIFDMGDIDNGNVSNLGNVTVGGTTATHNVAINTDSGYLYRTGGGSSGLRIYGLTNPSIPNFVGEWTDRYVHDAQVVTYDSGPYAGKEIAFCNTGGTLTILDVTSKTNIIELSVLVYQGVAYSHQGWTSDDKQYFFMNDELDESNFGVNTTTHIVDISNLSAPVKVGTFSSGSSSIDHNLYVRGDLIFEANYRSGLRVFDASNPTSPVEVGFFDTFPESDAASFNGMWSCFPYYPSGVVIGSDIEKGLFVWDIGEPALSYNFPNGIPSELGSNNATIDVVINETEPGTLDPSTAMMTYDDGSGFQTVPMTPTGGANFEATFGSLPCGANVEFYFSAQTFEGDQLLSPFNAPNTTYSALVVDAEEIFFSDDFETNQNWVVTNGGGLAAGAWERGTPVGGGDRGDPPTDADGSGQCYLTENIDGNSDVDGGTTTLTSPVMSADAEQPILSYYRWYHNSFGGAPFEDIMEVEVNDGSGWQILEVVGPAGNEVSGGWFLIENDLSQIGGFDLNGPVQVRFTVGDLGEGSVVEAGIDGVTMRAINCDDDPPACVGDVNLDGTVGVDDLLAFLSAWGSNDLTYDFDLSGTVGAPDLLIMLAAWGPCP